MKIYISIVYKCAGAILYSIFAPNFRGSTGYGLAFTKMVNGDWGYGPRLDNVAGLDWLIDNDYAEKGNILLMGGSGARILQERK